MKLLIATKNPSKLEEIRKFLGNQFELVSLVDLSGAPEVEETGKTFRENAFIKAKTYFAWSGMPTIADDGGLEILALNGQPGVKSRRWPGHEATDQELIDLALAKLSGVSWAARQACLVTVGTFYDSQRILTQSGCVHGYITESQMEQCKPGYPFRSIFWVPQFGKLFSRLTEEEHDIINHRKKVYEALAIKIAELAH